jgi:hypothetical protein
MTGKSYNDAYGEARSMSDHDIVLTGMKSKIHLMRELAQRYDAACGHIDRLRGYFGQYEEPGFNIGDKVMYEGNFFRVAGFVIFSPPIIMYVLMENNGSTVPISVSRSDLTLVAETPDADI